MTARTNTRRKSSSRTPLDAPTRRRLPPLLRQTWYSLNQAFGRRLAHLDLTPDQFTVLRWLYEGDSRGLTQSELARTMASDPNTVSGVLRRMEAAKLIARKAHEADARAHRIRLTARGRRVFSQAREVAVELQACVLSSLPAGERERFLEQLETVAGACREALLRS